MYAYLDNSATTRVAPEVIKIMEKAFSEDYGNPSSLHKMGFEAEKYVSEAQEIFSKILKCNKKNIVFTSGGTESNNTALIGTALFKESRGKHVITTEIEHPAVSEPLSFLEKRGWEIERLTVNSDGLVDPEELRQKLRPDTVLVSVMHVNNEIGAVEPVEEIGKIIHEKVPECFFHVDDIQGFGKIKLAVRDSYIDLLSVSSHKIHGPKGVGLLYMSDRASHIPPMMMGGGQQNGLRSGTVNVPGIAGFAEAAKLMYANIDDSYSNINGLRDFFVREALNIPDTVVNGGEKVSPYIVSLSVKGVRSEVLLHALEDREVYVSAGSACSTHKKHGSVTLKAIGLADKEAEETVRFSFSCHTTEEELKYAIDCLNDIVPGLRRFKRR
ncbi:MAG: cysteine desulfurase [Lachnospiraceae bacterium]|nr:cysteine desulfurase [Lachnospiraceae bacterium]